MEGGLGRKKVLQALFRQIYSIHHTEKMWQLYISPQYLANLTDPLVHAQIMYGEGLKFSDLFYAFFYHERF